MEDCAEHIDGSRELKHVDGERQGVEECVSPIREGSSCCQSDASGEKGDANDKEEDACSPGFQPQHLPPRCRSLGHISVGDSDKVQADGDPDVGRGKEKGTGNVEDHGDLEVTGREHHVQGGVQKSGAAG